ncbi:hypothetical protein ACJ41O_002249 [Fusarium nematophilum]
MASNTRKRKAPATKQRHRRSSPQEDCSSAEKADYRGSTAATVEEWDGPGERKRSKVIRLLPNVPAPSKKRKILVSDSRRQVQKQGQDFVKYIDKELKSSLFKKAGLEKELSSHLTPVLPWMTAASLYKKIDPHSRPQHMLKALNGLQRVVKAYGTLADKDDGIEAPTWMRWKQDVKELNELGRHGLNMASKIVNHVIMPNHHALPTKPAKRARDNEKLAWDLLENSVPRKSEEIWGKAVQGQVKAFSAVLKLLPECG